jgi:hypothetical protein
MKLNIRFIFFTLILLVPLTFWGQTTQFGDTSIIASTLEKLRELYDTQDTTFHLVTNNKILKINAVGTYISVDSKKGVINRIVLSSYTSKGIFSEEYIFYRGKCIFVYQTFEFFMEIPTKTKFTNFKGIKAWETRFYLGDDKLIYQKTAGIKEAYISYSADDLKNEKERILDFIKKKLE